MEGLASADFFTDSKTQDAVMMQLLVIGELATKIVADHPSPPAAIPWQQIKGMRNRMAHGYHSVDLQVVWDTVQTALPALEKQLRALGTLPG